MAAPVIEFSAEVETSAAPERVWAVMSDIGREPEWMQAVQRVEFTDGSAGYRPGARMRRAGRFIGMTLAWSSEVTEFRPDSLIAFRHTGGALSGESRWEIIPRPGGSTIRFSTRGPAPGPLAWFPALARLGGRLGQQRDVARLKRIAEQQA
jgi:uncharacterized protein YndB with AHSA1/START domain